MLYEFDMSGISLWCIFQIFGSMPTFCANAILNTLSNNNNNNNDITFKYF